MKRFVLIRTPVHLGSSIEGVYSSYEECDQAMSHQMHQFKKKISDLVNALISVHKDRNVGWIEAEGYTHLSIAQIMPLCLWRIQEIEIEPSKAEITAYKPQKRDIKAEVQNYLRQNQISLREDQVTKIVAQLCGSEEELFERLLALTVKNTMDVLRRRAMVNHRLSSCATEMYALENLPPNRWRERADQEQKVCTLLWEIRREFPDNPKDIPQELRSNFDRWSRMNDSFEHYRKGFDTPDLRNDR